ncbi:phosphoglycerate kinase [Hugenholtzia roseola]|uniref:phosphoglycerate kinase n=1 Tax=Hugenholtzia roseola TaxID=1002 RepID=UPI00040DC429|nr:phosphoglycerate kinase [Hugenholtzia roseola]
MRFLEDAHFEGKRVLVRVDFNVPLNAQFEITDDTRLAATLPTLRYILAQGGALVLMSHFGRPKNREAKYSLVHVRAYLEKALARQVLFAPDCIGQEAERLSQNLKSGEVLLLENVRYYTEETQNDPAFAQALARHGEIYVNDAFGAAHRAHASTTGVAKYFTEKICGKVMQAEIENANKVLEKAERPFTAIMGGAKISDKILIIEKLLPKIDHLIIGGGMAYTFFKAKGWEIGKSLLEADKVEVAAELLKKAQEMGVTIHLPQDSVVAEAFSNESPYQQLPSDALPADKMGLDIGSAAQADFAKLIHNSKTLLWNGPMGVFEMPNFAKGTAAIAKSVVEATQKGAFSLIGGGDSAAAIKQMGAAQSVSYVSTGGGALLEYMEGKILPGVAALMD